VVRPHHAQIKMLRKLFIQRKEKPNEETNEEEG
jgi:hypothetical protein